MNSHLQSENFSLRQQLESLLHEARCNEEKMRRFGQLERQLMGAGSLLELVRLLITEYKLAFGVEFVTLTLLDQDYEVTRVLENSHDRDIIGNGLTMRQSLESFEPLYEETRKPCLGAYDPGLHQPLFDASPGTIASVALLPLIRHGKLIGSLHFGSANPDRYVPGFGTDFLERLAEVISICLESTLAQERLKIAGITDGLTGVQNRRYFDHRLQEEISQARRHRRSLACMFLDIDKFKRINDTYGHQMGDEVLRRVAGIIQSQLRLGDTIARYGGEEFVVLLPRTSGHFVQEIAERIRSAIAEERFQTPAGMVICVTISIGLSMLPGEGMKAEESQLAAELVAAADHALYQAKHGGRNRVVCDHSLPSVPRHRPSWKQAGLVFAHWLDKSIQGMTVIVMGLLKLVKGA